MLTRIFPLVASLAILVAAQSPSQPASTLGCTTSSFTIPSWFVQDLQYSGAATSGSGNVTLNIFNRATNYTADMTCQVNGSGRNACAVNGKAWANETLHVFLQVNHTSAHIFVNETWACNDRIGTHPLTFKAVGNNSVALNCTNKSGLVQTCDAVDTPLLVKGSLLSPVAITPDYADGPAGHSAPGCVAAANSPSWTLSTIYYADQAGDGITSAPSQNFILQVINPVIGYQAGCMAGTPLDNDNPASNIIRLTCAGYEFQSLGSNRYQLQTDALFDPVTFRFTVNQTWYCDDVNPGKPISITATGSEILPLKCTNTPVEGAPSWNKTACVTDADVTLKGQTLSQVALPPYSIEDPLPTPDGCTLSSIFNPKWSFSGFEVDSTSTPAAGNEISSSSVSFNIILQTASRGFQFPMIVSQDAPAANGSWSKCVIGASDDTEQPLWPSDCSFQYTPTTQELILKADWVCYDLDKNHPILFSGMSVTNVNSSLACSTVDGVSQCLTADTSYSWSADISNVTWRQAI